MTVTDPGLLKTIIDNPGDDAPRLILADWLEDYGESERAEFIKAQVELATAPECCGKRQPGHKRTCVRCRPFDGLHRRERELLSSWWKWEDRWANHVWRIHSSESRILLGSELPFMELHYRRGFIDEIRCTMFDWFAHGPAIVSQHPVKRVTLTDKEPFLSDGRYYWTRSYYRDYHHRLPDDLYDALVETSGTWRFDTRQAAMDAISTACIHLARSKL
mgnify:CR=1 FL=1